MAQLTEQERQEVIRFIETGRALPDRYRFLLFEEKREAELLGLLEDIEDSLTTKEKYTSHLEIAHNA